MLSILLYLKNLSEVFVNLYIHFKKWFLFYIFVYDQKYIQLLYYTQQTYRYCAYIIFLEYRLTFCVKQVRYTFLDFHLTF
jgi:hypothetical protein